MPRPKAHYSLVLRNHHTGRRLRLKLIDLPFATSKSFRLRVNGQWAKKVPVASKMAVVRQLRAWWVKHWALSQCPHPRGPAFVLATTWSACRRHCV